MESVILIGKQARMLTEVLPFLAMHVETDYPRKWTEQVIPEGQQTVSRKKSTQYLIPELPRIHARTELTIG